MSCDIVYCTLYVNVTIAMREHYQLNSYPTQREDAPPPPFIIFISRFGLLVSIKITYDE